jgi:ribonuclease P protein component
MAAHAQGFPKAARLRKRNEFLAVQQGRASVQVSAACLLALALPNGTTTARLGLTVSSKVGNAVVRNRIRRHLREVFRTRIQELPKGIDVVLIARTSAAHASRDDLAKAFGQVSSRLKGSFS